jgi:hypothetical protein
MSKTVNDDVLDAALDVVVVNADRVDVCEVAPSTYAEATSTYTLADETMITGEGNDYNKADGDTSGRKVTVSAKNSITVEGTGMATHIALSDTSGSSLLYVTELGSVRSNTAQAGGSSSITLDAGASTDDDFYNNMAIRITSGTGSGQTRYITDYSGATKIAIVGSAWSTTPDATSVFKIFGQQLTAGNTINLPAWDIEIFDPKVTA